VPSAATMSCPWWVWPVRPAPKRASSPPKLYGPWTGKSLDVAVTAAGEAGIGVAAGGGVGATTLSGARR
jgi:hypothetical protein